MRLYLDDDSVQKVLVSLLRRASHDVLLPADIGVRGSHDAIHFKHAIQDNRVLLSHNQKDFPFLQELILAAGGRHPGLFVVRRDNDPKRDLKPRGIVRAIGNLLAASVPVADNLHILNHWR